MGKIKVEVLEYEKERVDMREGRSGPNLRGWVGGLGVCLKPFIHLTKLSSTWQVEVQQPVNKQ